VAVYQYKAVRRGGETVSGTLDADSARRARELLRQHGLYVTEMKPPPAAGRAGRWLQKLPFTGDRRRKLLWLTRELHLLVLTGMPLRDALASVGRSAPATLRPVVRALRDDISKGESLATAMQRHGNWFDGLYVSMVEAGENSGELGALLGNLTDYLQSQQRFRRQMQTALLYPKLVALAAFGVVVFLMSAVVPRFVEVIEQRGGELPLATRILKDVSDFLAAGWYWCAAGVVGLWALWQFAMSRPGVHLGWERLLLRVPVLGQFRRKQLAQQFAVMLGALLKGGVVLTDALDQIAETSDNPLIAQEAEGMRQKLVLGGDLASSSEDGSIFPRSFGDMLAAGQETGALESVLGTVEEAYSEDVEAGTGKIAALIEPLAILAVALVVGFIVAAVLLPVFELSQLQ